MVSAVYIYLPAIDRCCLHCIYMPAVDRPLSDCRFEDLEQLRKEFQLRPVSEHACVPTPFNSIHNRSHNLHLILGLKCVPETYSPE